MYVRIARFDGADGNWEERIEEVRKRMRGTSTEAAALNEVRGSIDRALMLVDREANLVASLLFCDSEETVRVVDEAMKRMSPPAGGGTRSSVEIYEVVVDEQPAQALRPGS
jgi:hypothetical protein